MDEMDSLLLSMSATYFFDQRCPEEMDVQLLQEEYDGLSGAQHHQADMTEELQRSLTWEHRIVRGLYPPPSHPPATGTFENSFDSDIGGSQWHHKDKSWAALINRDREAVNHRNRARRSLKGLRRQAQISRQRNLLETQVEYEEAASHTPRVTVASEGINSEPYGQTPPHQHSRQMHQNQIELSQTRMKKPLAVPRRRRRSRSSNRKNRSHNEDIVDQLPDLASPNSDEADIRQLCDNIAAHIVANNRSILFGGEAPSRPRNNCTSLRSKLQTVCLSVCIRMKTQTQRQERDSSTGAVNTAFGDSVNGSSDRSASSRGYDESQSKQMSSATCNASVGIPPTTVGVTSTYFRRSRRKHSCVLLCAQLPSPFLLILSIVFIVLANTTDIAVSNSAPSLSYYYPNEILISKMQKSSTQTRFDSTDLNMNPVEEFQEENKIENRNPKNGLSSASEVTTVTTASISGTPATWTSFEPYFASFPTPDNSVFVTNPYHNGDTLSDDSTPLLDNGEIYEYDITNTSTTREYYYHTHYMYLADRQGSAPVVPKEVSTSFSSSRSEESQNHDNDDQVAEYYTNYFYFGLWSGCRQHQIEIFSAAATARFFYVYRCSFAELESILTSQAAQDSTEGLAATTSSFASANATLAETQNQNKEVHVDVSCTSLRWLLYTTRALILVWLLLTTVCLLCIVVLTVYYYRLYFPYCYEEFYCRYKVSRYVYQLYRLYYNHQQQQQLRKTKEWKIRKRKAGSCRSTEKQQASCTGEGHLVRQALDTDVKDAPTAKMAPLGEQEQILTDEDIHVKDSESSNLPFPELPDGKCINPSAGNDDTTAWTAAMPSSVWSFSEEPEKYAAVSPAQKFRAWVGWLRLLLIITVVILGVGSFATAISLYAAHGLCRRTTTTASTDGFITTEEKFASLASLRGGTNLFPHMVIDGNGEGHDTAAPRALLLGLAIPALFGAAIAQVATVLLFSCVTMDSIYLD